jgi:pilus assembly protein Flp/PilA
MRPSRRPASPRLLESGKNKSALSWRADSGATAVEYGIIAGLLAVTIVVGVQISGNGLNRMFHVIGTTMSNATNSADSSTAGN